MERAGRNSMAIIVFIIFVVIVIGLSFYLGKRTKSSSGYYAAGGQIKWGVNGIAFAGDYLSAASFLGICGLIATVGFDGFLYSIGYLAGWVVALFVVAEPLKKLGKYTFTDALDSKFNSRSIKLTAAISTLVVSICYLIPQMVGAGVLVEPLLGIPHAYGVAMVGVIVITIVATAGMASTTYVQFHQRCVIDHLLTVLVIAVLVRGLSTQPDQGGKVPFYQYASIPATVVDGKVQVERTGRGSIGPRRSEGRAGICITAQLRVLQNWWHAAETDQGLMLNGIPIDGRKTRWRVDKRGASIPGESTAPGRQPREDPGRERMPTQAIFPF